MWIIWTIKKTPQGVGTSQKWLYKPWLRIKFKSHVESHKTFYDPVRPRGPASSTHNRQILMQIIIQIILLLKYVPRHYCDLAILFYCHKHLRKCKPEAPYQLKYSFQTTKQHRVLSTFILEASKQQSQWKTNVRLNDKPFEQPACTF